MAYAEALPKNNAPKIFGKEMKNFSEIESQSQTATETLSASDPTEMIHADVRVLGLRLGGQHFGVNISAVAEIVRQVEVIELPELPDFIAGVIDVRGRIIPLIKLRARLGIEDKACDASTEIIIAAMGGADIGLVVDRVTEIIPLRTDQILAPDKKVSPLARYLWGIADLERELIPLLDLNAVVDFERIALPQDEAVPRRRAEKPPGVMSEEQELLHKRAIELSKKNEEDRAEKRQLVTFTLANEWYALNIDRIKEISSLLDIYYIPGAPPHIVGTINLRGVIIPVIDMRSFFELPEAQFTRDASIIIVEQNHTMVGLIVDSVADIVDLPVDFIEPPLATLERAKAEYLLGEADWEDKLFCLLNLENIICSITQASH